MTNIIKENNLKTNSSRAGVVGCGLMLMGMYFLLLGPGDTIFSVHTLCAKTEALCTTYQFLVFCLLPIYFSLMIFGGGAVGWLLGNKTRKFFTKKLNQFD